jgi:hypothetical protein
MRDAIRPGEAQHQERQAKHQPRDQLFHGFTEPLRYWRLQ